MLNSQKLAKNTLYLTLASIAQKVIAFAYFSVVARYIGVEGTGSYFLALAVTGVMSVFADLGLTSVLIREVAKKGREPIEWVRNIVGIKLIAVPITLIATFIIPIFLNYDADITLLIRIAAFILVADTVTLSFYGVLRGLHSLKYEAIGIFTGQTIVAVVGSILLFTNTATIPLLIGVLLLGSTWNMFFSAFQVARKLTWKALLPSYSMGFKPLKIALAFFLAAIFVKLYSYIDTITLSKVLGQSAVGIYAVAYKFTYAFQFLPLAFVASLYPTMSQYSDDKDHLKKILLDAFWYMGLLGFPIVFGIFALSDQIILTVYGADYEQSIIALQILIFALIPIFLDFPVGSLLNATNRQTTKMVLMGITMLINLTANLILIPKFGVIGASIAGLISFSFLFISGFLVTRSIFKLSIIDIIKRIGGLFISSIGMAIVVIFIKEYVNIVVSIFAGAVIYISSAFMTRSFTVEHLKSIKHLLLKK